MNPSRSELEIDERSMRKFDYWESSSEENISYLESNGLLFELDYLDYKKKSSEEKLLLCKPIQMVEEYIRLFSQCPHGRILEFGIFEGGSAIFYATLLKNIERIVSVDQRSHSQVVENIIRKCELQDKVKLHYKTPQDSPIVRSIVMNELEGKPDIIIDDCSHLYGPTKGTFQMMFPLLAPGGLYIIEDWAWAHRPRHQVATSVFNGEIALTNLLFELIALKGTQIGWFQEITINKLAMLIIKKGYEVVDDPLDITAATAMRGKTIGYI